jgi:hypothetical protein
MPAKVVTIAKADEQSTALGELQEKRMARTNHLGTLAAVAVGAALTAVGLVVLMVVEVCPAEATFPGKNGKI